MQADSLGPLRNLGTPSGRLEGFPVQGALPCPPVLAANLGSERALWLALPAARIETWAPEPEQKPTGRFPPRRAREKKGCEKRSRTEKVE
jgi:hypothetical protein